GPDTDGNGISDRIVYQWDFADNDADASDVAKGHGSHVASLIASSDSRYGGVAQGTELIVLKVFGDDGHGTFRDLERALQWVVANADAWNVGVVNLSLGDTGNWTDAIGRYGLADEFAALSRRDLVVVGAAGNSYATQNRMGVAYPAADPAVLAVGATWAGDFGGPWRFGNGSVDYTTGADRIAGFSQRDTTLTDTFAPGARFNGADANGGVRTMQGTSQAAAFVSGTAAIAQQVAMETLGRRLTTGEFATLLRTTGASIVDGDDENDNVTNTGATFGRVDVEALVAAIAGLPETPPDNGGGTGGGSSGGGGTTTPSNVAAPGVHVADVSAGETVSALDFGNFELARVEGRVVNDVDADGVVDAGESGLAGRTVFLDADADGVFDTGEAFALTGTDGRYTITGVGPGTFRVSQSVPDGWANTQPGGFVEYTATSGDTEVVELTQAEEGFRVTSITATATGFQARFNRAFDAALVNLYGATASGAPDVVVTGPGNRRRAAARRVHGAAREPSRRFRAGRHRSPAGRRRRRHGGRRPRRELHRGQRRADGRHSRRDARAGAGARDGDLADRFADPVVERRGRDERGLHSPLRPGARALHRRGRERDLAGHRDERGRRPGRPACDDHGDRCIAGRRDRESRDADRRRAGRCAVRHEAGARCRQRVGQRRGPRGGGR
ncbi:MAG: S8 family serine peptidase, partial [Gemmatimonadaceae bacterium]|nr:S8 family serine peptidase [Gemmatimonadaceae bacterium]